MTQNTRPQAEDFSHWFETPVRWGDLDSLGHVNNAVFFTFDESARLDYFSTLLHADTRFWKDYGLILAHIECDFLAQLRFPATVHVGMRVSRMGRSSLNTEAGLFVDEQLVAVTRSVIVWFDYPAQKSMPIPEPVRTAIRARERIEPIQAGNG